MLENWIKRTGILLLALAGLSGCISAPPPSDEMMAGAASYRLPILPEEGKAIAYVIFAEPHLAQIQFGVFLDGKGPESVVGYNRGGQYIYFSLPPGEHTVLSKAENWAEMKVSVKAGDVLFLRQEFKMGWTDAQNQLATLTDPEGKYYVKALTAGTIVSQSRPIDLGRLGTGAPKSATIAGQAPPVAAPPGLPGRTEQEVSADTLVGTVTGGRFTRAGILSPTRFNIYLEVTSDSGMKEALFVRADSKVFDANGTAMDWSEAFRSKDKRVRIEHYVITDATGGYPSSDEFGYEIGRKGVRTLRYLDWTKPQ